MKICKQKTNSHRVSLYPGIRIAVLAALICILGLCPPVSAQLLPINDNTSAPFLGVFGGPLYSYGSNRDDNYAAWLGRSTLWVEGFNGGTGNTWTWTNGIEGNSGYFTAARRWVQAHPGSMYVLGVGMLPGTDFNPATDTDGTKVSLAKGANGNYDSHFVTLAQKLAQYGPPDENVIVRLGWEFNGTWYPWGLSSNDPNRSPAHFKVYFARIVKAMRDVPGCENLKFCWNGSNNWTGYNVSEAYPRDIPESTVFPVHPAYPGNGYVDYVGVDQYDTADTDYYPPTSQADTDNAWIKNQLGTTSIKGCIAVWKAVAENPLQGNGKPLCFPEWGLSSNTSKGGLDNPEFIRHMFEFIHDPANNVGWHIYFDTNASSDHHISAYPYGTPSPHANAAAKYKQLFGLSLPNKNDIGSPGLAGSADGSTVRGAGNGYLSTASDSFFFSSRQSSVNDMFVVKLTSVSGGTTAQSGAMLRQGFGAGDKYAALFLRNGQCVFQSRTTAGAASIQNGQALSVATPTPSAPVWLKLVRRGDAISGYYSTDQANWNYAGGVNLSLSGTSYVGLAAASGNTTALNAVGTDSVDNADFFVGLDRRILAQKVIVDNGDSGSVTTTGTWTAGPSKPPGYEAESLEMVWQGTGYVKAAYNGPASSMTFTPNLPKAGLYEVYLRTPQSTAFAHNAPVTITSLDGVASLSANQSVGRYMWSYAGTYNFAIDGSGSVKISNSTTPDQDTIADAVLFVPLPQRLEAESITTVASSDPVTNYLETEASNGEIEKLGSNAVNDYVTYTVPVSVAGTYQVRIGGKKTNARAKYQLSIDGVNQGAVQDQYASAISYIVTDLGTVTFATGGNKAFKFTVTGKHSSSTDYTLGFDFIDLVPVAPLRFEVESLTSAAVPALDAPISEISASNGIIHKLSATADGNYVTYTVPVAAAGTYNVKIGIKKANSRGKFQLTIDGVNQGTVQDQYLSWDGGGYVVVDLGPVTFASAGDKQFKFTVAGKTAASSGRSLAFDYIDLQR